jgi:Bacterial Ig-like domain
MARSPVRARPARGALTVAVAMLAVVTGSCAKKDSPTAPPTPMPPTVQAVHPAARSVDVPVETAIWAQFDVALDPATVDAAHVLLTRDTRRIPIAVSWDPATRRVLITPQAPLELLRTHTVTFSDGLRAADGATLGGEFFWQFTTSSVRAPARPFPPTGSTFESPFVRLSWDATESTAGAARYTIYVSPDSAAVATRAVPPLAVLNTAVYLPNQPWSLGTKLCWAVDAENMSTQEASAGPVWRFETLPQGTPVDSMVVPAVQWGSARRISGLPDLVSCFGQSFSVGNNYNGAIDWNLDALGADVRLADVSLLMSPSSSSTSLTGRVETIYGTTDAWEACGIVPAGPPYPDQTFGALATGVPTAASRLLFASVRLTAHVEARIRGAALTGYTLDDFSGNFTYASPSATDSNRRPLLIISYFITPAPVERGAR